VVKIGSAIEFFSSVLTDGGGGSFRGVLSSERAAISQLHVDTA